MRLQKRLYRSQDRWEPPKAVLERNTTERVGGYQGEAENEIYQKIKLSLKPWRLSTFETRDDTTATVDKLRTAARYSSDEPDRTPEKARSELAEAETRTSATGAALGEQGRRSTAEEQIRVPDEELVEALADLESARDRDMISAELSNRS
jgi:hypothetical protein